MTYLYYRLWQHFKRMKTNDMPAINAMIFISLCEFANIFLVYILLSYFNVIDISIKSKIDAWMLAIPIGIIIYTINYFYLYKNRDKLLFNYKSESKKQKTLGSIFLLLYIIGSFALVFYFGPKYSTSIMN